MVPENRGRGPPSTSTHTPANACDVRTRASKAPGELLPCPPVTRPLIVTQGDPEGVGPELLLHLAAAGKLEPKDCVVGDRMLLQRLAGELDPPWAKRGWTALAPLVVEPPHTKTIGQVAVLRHAVDRVLANPGSALVTAPIDKARCRDEGFEFPGHTEYLAARASTDDFAMLMAGPTLKVVLATIHLPLREVPTALTPAAIVRAGRLLASALHRDFAITSPRIGVLGLNPHAGERGLLGDDEIRTIAPAIAALRTWAGQQSWTCTFLGPLAADTAFPQHAAGHLDGVVAMYHDQGLGPFKLMHMHNGVNMTLGLPFVRTSPDHGTARDIARTGTVNPESMLAATNIARGGQFEPRRT